MCSVDVVGEVVVGHTRQGTERAAAIVLQVAQQEVCFQVFFKQDLLAADIASQHGSCNVKTHPGLRPWVC